MMTSLTIYAVFALVDLVTPFGSAEHLVKLSVLLLSQHITVYGFNVISATLDIVKENRQFDYWQFAIRNRNPCVPPKLGLLLLVH